MPIEINGKTIETDGNGNLVNLQDWNREVAEVLAVQEDIDELTQEHWDVLEYLRDEYLNNNGNQPMERQINKDMGKRWGKKISSKDLYRLFPRAPSKQGNKIAGLPFVARKGGY
ncbi:MAG: TusE/DsrC/DsvC family sulfur relay protein [Candidatus Thiosymbion ectosymbiont of Robbea hypermnestra]|nr:TusE/DsrC/DsvC family sulfur relay protein [Candidatus Thiosymbion ectosymbiont of Robbea hypermnestra]